ncbi:MAG: 16S rRNA (uracil(1498)-N(3))-methyltransferase [Bacteroidales bacterium]|nr:16S rRNA (uracil(1498)-N(3))-methyltransferase [Bacteroidales bacterium]
MIKIFDHPAMQLFYVTGITGHTCTLTEEESRHCVKALRLKNGDQIRITDGLGRFYLGRLADTDPRGTLVEIIKYDQVPPLHSWKLHIAIAPTKNIERFEWFLEKATEIGINEITPLICEHSERTAVKLPRLEKVVISALKQSLGAWLPTLNEAQYFTDFIQQDHPGQRFIAWCETGGGSELSRICQMNTDTVILIGPEGDFSPAEISLAKQTNFIPVSLGKRRLRTETAGIVACHTVDLLNRLEQ